MIGGNGSFVRNDDLNSELVWAGHKGPGGGRRNGRRGQVQRTAMSSSQLEIGPVDDCGGKRRGGGHGSQSRGSEDAGESDSRYHIEMLCSNTRRGWELMNGVCFLKVGQQQFKYFFSFFFLAAVLLE